MPNRDQPLIGFIGLWYKTENSAGNLYPEHAEVATDPPFEIVAIDDHSPDKTGDMLQSFNEPRLRAFRNERNFGQEFSIKRGMRLTRGESVVRIDSDDRYRPDFLARTMPMFGKYPEVGVVYGDSSFIGDRGRGYTTLCDGRHGGKLEHAVLPRPS